MKKSFKLPENRIKCLASCLLKTMGTGNCLMEAANKSWVGKKFLVKEYWDWKKYGDLVANPCTPHMRKPRSRDKLASRSAKGRHKTRNPVFWSQSILFPFCQLAQFLCDYLPRFPTVRMFTFTASLCRCLSQEDVVPLLGLKQFRLFYYT